jgi:hypothetical protein
MNVYRSDVERICDAEHRSGRTVKADAAGVMKWISESVTSAQGVVLENQLQAESARDRAVQLRSEARAQALGGCPVADAFEAYAVDDEYRTAVQSLCNGEASSGARLDVAPADDAERMREIRDWTLTNLRGPLALAFVDRLAQTEVQGRPALLLAEASRLGLPGCALSATLERPPPTPIPVTLVVLPSYAVSRVDAPQKIQDAVLGTLAVGNAAQVIDNCYGQALLKSPTLAGSVTLRLTLDKSGKLTKAEETSSSLGSPQVVKCIASGLPGSLLIPAQPDKAPPVKCTATLSFVPVRGSPPPAWPSVMPTGLKPSDAPDAGLPPDAGKKKKGAR